MESKSSDRFFVYPLVPMANGRHSIADITLVDIWEKIEAEGKVEQLFYDGSIRDIQGWLNFIKAPGVYPIIIWNHIENRVTHVAWLKDCFDVCAYCHHVAIGKYQRGAWEAALAHWKQFDSLKLLLGLTPKTNTKAVRFVKQICKFTIVGEIPLVCKMAYEDNQRVPGILSYYKLEG